MAEEHENNTQRDSTLSIPSTPSTLQSMLCCVLRCHLVESGAILREELSGVLVDGVAGLGLVDKQQQALENCNTTGERE